MVVIDVTSAKGMDGVDCMDKVDSRRSSMLSMLSIPRRCLRLEADTG